MMGLSFNLKKSTAVLSIVSYIAITAFLSLYAIERTTFNFSNFNFVTDLLRYFIFSIGLVSCFLYESKLKTALCTVYFIVAYITHKFSGSYFSFQLFYLISMKFCLRHHSEQGVNLLGITWDLLTPTL